MELKIDELVATDIAAAIAAARAEGREQAAEVAESKRQHWLDCVRAEKSRPLRARFVAFATAAEDITAAIRALT